MLINTVEGLRDALATFDVTKRIYMDCETTSFDDNVEAFHPYKGHRATLVIIGQPGVQTVAVALRHRDEVHVCIDNIEEAKAMLAQWAATVQILANLNLKFDMHFVAQDAIFFTNARCEDTGVLARVVYNEHPRYSLAELCKFYSVEAKADEYVKEWKAANPKCKDYGRIPMSILVPYGIADVDSAIALHEELLRRLPEESQYVWDVECGLTPILFGAERRGLLIDEKFIMRKKFELLVKLIAAAKEINKLTGIENPSSGDEYGAYFESLGIKSTKLTDKGNPSWNKDVLDYIASLGQDVPHKVAKMLFNYSKDEVAESMFCTGWLKHLTPDGRVHYNVRQTGTVSLRSSSNEPNVQNLPKWLLEGVLIPNDRIGVAWDLSQIEYRLFAHYAKDDVVLAKYAETPKIDYHQILADRLGTPRNPTKRINFGILYGMGKGKTTATLRNEIIEYDSMELRQHLYGQYYDPFAEVPQIEIPIPQDVLVTIADNVLKEYHVQNPSIKRMQGEIKSLLYKRGYVKSYYGMRFYLEVKRAYVGLNRVIQGSAATLFKEKLVKLHKACTEASIDMAMDMQIHDAVYATVPITQAQRYVEIAHKVVTDCPFRVPVLMDFEIALGNWKNKMKINHDSDVLAEAGKICFVK